MNLITVTLLNGRSRFINPKHIMEYKTVGKITNLVCKDKTFQIKESEDQIAKLIEDLKQ